MKDMKKIKCPYCGHEQYPFYGKDATCKGVFFKCRNRNCKKEFELRL